MASDDAAPHPALLELERGKVDAMTEQAIERIEDEVPEFTDELSDEALDRDDSATYTTHTRR
jgi:hypothetical protein